MPDGKVWMAENLNYQSGLTFNQQSNQANGKSYTSAANGVPAIGSFWCPAVSGATLSADRNTCNVYGALYTWETAMTPNGKLQEGQSWDELSVSYRDVSIPPSATQGDQMVQGICPAGWHLPSEYEWAYMLDAVDPTGSYTAQVGGGNRGAIHATDGSGVQLKSASTYMGTDPGTGSWINTDSKGSNATGFNALPSGRINHPSIPDSFVGRGTVANFFTLAPLSETTMWTREVISSRSDAARWSITRRMAMSVRCLSDI
jgi:uncharacterized protein (TIGR02145 family)